MPDKPLAMVLKFTRAWCVKPFFDNFDRMEFSRSMFDLYIHIGIRRGHKHCTDSAGYRGLMNEVSYEGLREALDSSISSRADEFRSFAYTYEDDVPHKQRPACFTHASAGMLLYLKGLIKQPWQVQIEDDVLPPIDGVKRLLAMKKKYPKVPFFSIPYTYRRSVPGIGFHRMGCGCQAKMKFEGPLLVYKEACSPRLEGVQEIEGSHFGFFLTKTDVWKHAFDDILSGKLKGCYLGDDGVVCHSLIMKGYKLLADFDAWCGHMQAVGDRYDNDGSQGIHVFTRNMAVLDAYWFNEKSGKYDVGAPGRKPGIPRGMWRS